MSERAVAISLKIPDNEAYTTLTALRRLGVAVEKVERSEIWRVEDTGEEATFVSRIESNETIFNPNKHRLAVLEKTQPRPGEVWIEELGRHNEVREHLGGKIIPGLTNARRYVGWRLISSGGSPAGEDVLQSAVQKLLCNPAIEKPIY